jgi:hypothetical protein
LENPGKNDVKLFCCNFSRNNATKLLNVIYTGAGIIPLNFD